MIYVRHFFSGVIRSVTVTSVKEIGTIVVPKKGEWNASRKLRMCLRHRHVEEVDLQHHSHCRQQLVLYAGALRWT